MPPHSKGTFSLVEVVQQYLCCWYNEIQPVRNATTCRGQCQGPILLSFQLRTRKKLSSEYNDNAPEILEREMEVGGGAPPVSRMRVICRDTSYPFPDPRSVQVLDGGKVSTDDPFCRPNCSL
ncbi:hypothetical protein AMECASPLE_031331 [Ameca splendens]|uniref:Uncharacterized protein n=1 Tax=Ameca splendens TaxID=208324 RepID=A0ABV1ACP3_9TELE